uniref:Transposon protein, putative, CACTA, En/Spm sub-class n=2 Tax=Oryza sativa subsp. japonica TaxID=39947 RepID=Q2R7F8_ORYSJ|nr:transposon protein, putative, CACTA, En/Spm sub-class [Oryza sativa Japonica Group]ABA92557.1 transposon protein, putative, unclassified [Oryza sativa Japonica Group]
MEEAALAEGDGGAAPVDGVVGVPAVGDRNGGVDEVREDAAKPREAAPGQVEDRGGDGEQPELGGDGGKRGRRRERESDEVKGRRVAETVVGSSGRVYIGLGV